MPIDIDIGPVAKQMFRTVISQQGLCQASGDNGQGGLLKPEPQNLPDEAHDHDVFVLEGLQDVSPDINYGNGRVTDIPYLCSRSWLIAVASREIIFH
jgi:hypothetical protein